jgi:hypothetical protein
MNNSRGTVMNLNDYQRAYILAKSSHGDDLNSKCGELYFNHCVRVSRRFVSWGQYLEAATAILHDTLEDTGVDANQIKAISEDLFNAVNALTKTDKLTYKAYKHQVKSNSVAAAVKLEDLLDNFNLNRIQVEVTIKDAKRSLRYATFACQLVGVEDYGQNENEYIERGFSVQELIRLTCFRDEQVTEELNATEALNMVKVAEALVHCLS